MILKIARFWASLTTYHRARERYEIRGVMGPDEYHDRSPGADAPGLNNNAYTNIMAVWTLQCGLKVFDLLAPDHRQELCQTLHLRDEELARWHEITCKMRIGFHDGGIISQFEGYEVLEEFDWVRVGRILPEIRQHPAP
jgi:trehalose/maltose hydrolase-like predicted phosphorylase